MPATTIRAGLIDPPGRPARAEAAPQARTRAPEKPRAPSVLAERLAIREENEP